MEGSPTMIISESLSMDPCWVGRLIGRPSGEVWVQKSWRIIDGRGIGREFCCGEDIGRGSCCGENIGRDSCFGEYIGGGSGSGWIKTGGERNEKSDGILESPFRVCNIQ